MSRSALDGERERLAHAIERLETVIATVRLVLSTRHMLLGRTEAKSVLEAAGVVATTIARLELLRAFEGEKRGQQCARCGLAADAKNVQRLRYIGCPQCCDACEEATGGVCPQHAAAWGERESPER